MDYQKIFIDDALKKTIKELSKVDDLDSRFERLRSLDYSKIRPGELWAVLKEHLVYMP